MYTSPDDSCVSETSSAFSTSSSASPFRRSRFEHLTRREALERRFAKSKSPPDDEKKEDSVVSMEDATPLVSNRSGASLPRFSRLRVTEIVKTPPRTPDRNSRIEKNQLYSSVSTTEHESSVLARSADEGESKPPTPERNCRLEKNESYSSVATTEIESTVTARNAEEDESCCVTDALPSSPQHLYRVSYRGVVALLAAPHAQAPRSDSYLSYGEVFVSGWEQPLGEDKIDVKNSSKADSRTVDGPRMIRVDKMLTGGYSLRDPGSIVGDSNREKCDVDHGGSLGFLFSSHGGHMIVERVQCEPEIDEGVFLYKVISSSPLPILSGPSYDAPLTSAMALPASVLEVSLRVSQEGTCFLRLLHRRGWIADRRPGDHSVVLVKEIPADGRDDCDQSILSSVSALTVATTSSLTRLRHRPPRRRADATNQEAFPKAHPRVNSVILPNAASVKTASTSEINAAAKRLTSPISNVSVLSDDSAEQVDQSLREAPPTSPDVSYSTAKSAGSSSTSPIQFFLMRVTAPRGLKVLDAPQFQVNNLIHGVSSSHMVSQLEPQAPKTHHSIFQTMSGRTTGPSRTGNPAVFDSSSKTRVLPRGALFEASKRMERIKSTGTFSQGSGLIKLSDNSGWAIVPRKEELDYQYRSFHGLKDVKEGEASRAYQEVGEATLHDSSDTIWLRVQPRSGLVVSCPPPITSLNDGDTSPTSSRGSSTISGSHAGSNFLLTGQDSDVASSVGSAFLDAMFRTPNKKKKKNGEDTETLSHLTRNIEKPLTNDTVPCGMCVEVESWSDPSSHGKPRHEYARLHGGQGWVPIALVGKVVSVGVHKPEFRFGSFWFRVQSSRGIRARRGPSHKAPSIRSEDGTQVMRFECGEFLRASEIMTVFSDNGKPSESFAKLYRNRHIQLHRGHEVFRNFLSLTTPSEWVQIYGENDLFLEECVVEPHIERHRQGWRYNVVPDCGVSVRKGPSFAAETTGTILFGGESVIVTERVSPGGGESITWLRLRDGQWVHDFNDDGTQVMIAHSLRHRQLTSKPKKTPRSKDGKDIAYNAIVARLFHNSPGEGNVKPSS